MNTPSFLQKQRIPSQRAWMRRRRVGLLLALGVGAVGLIGAAIWAQETPGSQLVARANPDPRGAPSTTAAPLLRFQHLSIEDGLSQINVSAVLQDRRGFMWFGTQDGLNRYDGYRFTVHRPIPFDTTSLLDSGSMALAEDSAGAVWVSVGVAAEQLDPHTGRVRHYRHDPRDPTSLSPGAVSTFHVDPSGAVWLGMTESGLNRFDPSTARFSHYRHDAADPSSLSSDAITAIYTDAGGVLWVATMNGLNRLTPGGDTFRRYLYDPNGTRPTGALWTSLVPVSPAERAGFVTALCDDPNAPGVLWVATVAGLVRLDTRTGQTRRLSPDTTHPDGNILSDVLPDPRAPGVLWVASLGSQAHGGGLYHFDTHTERFTAYRHDPDNPSSLVADRLLGLYADRTGLVWANPVHDGVDRFDPVGTAFVHGRSVPGEPNSLSHDLVWAFAEDREGRLWIATSGGLDRLDRATGTYTHVRNGPPYIRALLVDRLGALWMGGQSGGVDRMDGATGQLTRFPPSAEGTEGLPPGRVNWLYEDRAGTLWVGGVGGLSRLEAGGRTFVRLSPESFWRSGVGDLLEDAAGGFWVGTGDGLAHLDRARGTVTTTYRHDPRDEGSLSSNVIITAHERAREPGVLWIGTQSGLNRFDSRTGRATHFTMRDGLPNPVIYGILEDERGHLWLSTGNGLSEFDPARRTFTNYGSDVCLQSREFTTAYFRSPRTGELFFGGVNGFNAFFPDRITRNTNPPAVVLTGLRLFNRPIPVSDDGPLRAPIEEAEEVRLQPTENVVTFEFVALHYQDPARNRYAYRLEGFNDDWVEAGIERTATYTNLDPGTYTFRVRASNSDGVWNEEGASIRVVVLPAWWQTWWARLLGVLALGGLVWAGYRVRTAQVRAHNVRLREEVAQQTFALTSANARLQKLDRMRRDFFANVSHEFRTPLTLILGPLEDLRARLARLGGDGAEREYPAHGTAATLDVAHRNARRLLRLINQLLDAAKLEDGAMPLDARPGDLARLVRDVGEAFVGLAERRGVTFRIVGADAPLEGTFAADAVEKVLANLLSNAFKFTPAGGTVALQLNRARRDGRAFATIDVRDNGSGIEDEARAHVFERFYQVDEAGGVGTGIGLALAKELAELHGGAIELESTVGFGSTFTFLLPLDLSLEGAETVPAGAPAASESLARPRVPTEARVAAEMLEPDTGGSSPAWNPAPALLDLHVRGDGVVFDADLIAIAEEAAHEAAEQEADRPLVLVADDNADIRAYVRRHLQECYRVVEAADGAEALQIAREHVPDLVLSDVMMPGMDGLALLRALKADPEMDFVPVVLLTAKAAVEDRLEGLHAHADDYLTKPFDVAELKARVENLIAGRQRLRRRPAREAASGQLAPAATPEKLHAAPIAVVSADAVFLERVREAVEEHLGEAAFGVEAFADAVGMSRVHLFRRLRDLCGETPTALLLRMRMERAAALLRGRAGNVSEVAYGVGFRSVSRFAKAFRAHAGTTPSAYAEQPDAA